MDLLKDIFVIGAKRDSIKGFNQSMSYEVLFHINEDKSIPSV